MLRTIVTAIACCVLTGCASKMAFDKNTTALDTREKSIVLMTLDVSRSDDSRYVPRPFLVNVGKSQPQGTAERTSFQFSEKDALKQADGTLYLIRVALGAGDYRVLDVNGMANAFPFVGSFIVPLVLDLKVKPGAVTYVGRVTAKLRDRKEGDFRAGPLLPLIDQAATGMTGGTWDVSVDNQAEKDLALFRSTYPVLNSVTIDTSPLPSFDRAAAYRYWDNGTIEPVVATQPVVAPARIAAP